MHAMVSSAWTCMGHSECIPRRGHRRWSLAARRAWRIAHGQLPRVVRMGAGLATLIEETPTLTSKLENLCFMVLLFLSSRAKTGGVAVGCKFAMTEHHQLP